MPKKLRSTKWEYFHQNLKFSIEQLYAWFGRPSRAVAPRLPKSYIREIARTPEVLYKEGI